MTAGAAPEDFAEADRTYLGDKYKREVSGRMTSTSGTCRGRMRGEGRGLAASAALTPPSQTACVRPPTHPPPSRDQVIEHMSATQLIDICLINPTVHLTPSGRDTGFTASYTFEPLSNLVYTRDQQVGWVAVHSRMCVCVCVLLVISCVCVCVCECVKGCVG